MTAAAPPNPSVASSLMNRLLTFFTGQWADHYPTIDYGVEGMQFIETRLKSPARGAHRVKNEMDLSPR